MANERLGYPDVAFWGLPGAGKTTGAKMLAELGWTPVSFAGFHRGGLRDIAERIWGAEATQDRAKLNALAALTDFDTEVWTRPYFREVDYLLADGETTVVTDDMRRDLEYRALRERGFVLVRVDAPEELRVARLTASGKFQGLEQLYEPIQVGLINYEFDYTVVNDASLSDFQDDLAYILQTERRKRQ